jgi:hypothetical protein
MSNLEIKVIDFPDSVSVEGELTYAAIVKNHGPFWVKGVKVIS